MRSDKELGEVLLANQELFSSGLCSLIVRLWGRNLITENEYDRLIHILHCNKPKGASLYYWPVYQIQPRLDWINRVLINGEKV